MKQKSVTVYRKKKEGLKLYPFQGIRQLGTLSKNDPCLLHKKEGWKRRMRIDFPSKKKQKIGFFLLLFPLLSYYIPSYKGIVLFLSSNHSYLPFVEPIELPFIAGKKFKSDRIVEAPYQLGFLQKQKLFHKVCMFFFIPIAWCDFSKDQSQWFLGLLVTCFFSL